MDAYLYLKAIHILAVISWMVGMLYLPRLFVYHCNKNNSEKTNKIFVLMEKRLLRYIMTPAGVFTWVFGLLLFYHPYSSIDFFSFWFCQPIKIGLHLDKCKLNINRCSPFLFSFFCMLVPKISFRKY